MSERQRPYLTSPEVGLNNEERERLNESLAVLFDRKKGLEQRRKVGNPQLREKIEFEIRFLSTVIDILCADQSLDISSHWGVLAESFFKDSFVMDQNTGRIETQIPLVIFPLYETITTKSDELVSYIQTQRELINVCLRQQSFGISAGLMDRIEKAEKKYVSWVNIICKCCAVTGMPHGVWNIPHHPGKQDLIEFKIDNNGVIQNEDLYSYGQPVVDATHDETLGNLASYILRQNDQFQKAKQAFEAQQNELKAKFESMIQIISQLMIHSGEEGLSQEMSRFGGFTRGQLNSLQKNPQNIENLSKQNESKLQQETIYQLKIQKLAKIVIDLHNRLNDTNVYPTTASVSNISPSSLQTLKELGIETKYSPLEIFEKFFVITESYLEKVNAGNPRSSNATKNRPNKLQDTINRIQKLLEYFKQQRITPDKLQTLFSELFLNSQFVDVSTIFTENLPALKPKWGEITDKRYIKTAQQSINNYQRKRSRLVMQGFRKFYNQNREFVNSLWNEENNSPITIDLIVSTSNNLRHCFLFFSHS